MILKFNSGAHQSVIYYLLHELRWQMKYTWPHLHWAVAETLYRGPEEVGIKESINKSIEHFPPTQPKEIIWLEVLRGQSKCMRQHRVQVMFILMGPISQEIKAHFISGRISTYLWTRGKGRKLRVEVISSPQSNIIVVDLNLSTLHGKVGCPDRQYWGKKKIKLQKLSRKWSK